jgi:predicted Zn-dependent peptidase
LIELQMDEPVTAEELALAQNALIGQNQRLLDQPLGRAAQLGEGLLVHGDPEWLEQAASALESVTAEEVQRVGQRYFAGPLAIIRILPEP